MSENLEYQNEDIAEDNGVAEEVETMLLEPLSYKDFCKAYPKKLREAVLSDIKDAAFSLDADKFNMSMSVFLNMIGLNVDTSQATQMQIEMLVDARVGHIPELKNTYEVLSIGREFFSMLSAPASITNIAIENMKQNVLDIYTVGNINNEQMASAYHNFALLYENYENSKNPYDRGKSKNVAEEYMAKALALTSNIQLISTCNNYVELNSPNRRLLMQEACERALKRHKLPSDKFQIYTLYAKSFDDKSIANIFNSKQTENKSLAIIYYGEALKYTSTSNDRIKTLHSLAKLQKNFDTEGYFLTRQQLAETLNGRHKVVELMSLATEVSGAKKIRLLEGAVNELIDTKTIPIRERQLMWQNISNNLRSEYGNKKSKIIALEQLEQIYFPGCKYQKEELIDSTSSKGNNYFGKIKKSR